MEKAKYKQYWKVDNRKKSLLKSTHLEMITVKSVLNSLINNSLCSAFFMHF